MKLESVVLTKEGYLEVCKRIAEKTDYFENCTELRYDFCLSDGDGRVALCKIRRFPKGKTLEVVAAVANGGTNFKETLDEIEVIAKSMGCKHMMIDGRLGWIKALPDYSVSSVTLTKTL